MSDIEFGASPEPDEEKINLAMDEDEPSIPPSALCWDTTNVLVTNFVEVLRDKLTVKYAGKANSHSDVGAIRTTHPLPSNASVFYFEIKVLSAGEKGTIVIGLADDSFRLNRQPGWERGSYGFQGNGRKFFDSAQGEPYARPFTTSDTVGCGLIFSRQELFFTKNGQHLGVAFSGIEAAVLYPVVSLHSRGEEICANFGKVPFLFNLDKLIADESERERQQQESYSVNVAHMNAAVISYLSTNGYASTLRMFLNPTPVNNTTITNTPQSASSQSKTSKSSNGTSADGLQGPELQLRSSLRQMILEGRAIEALQVVKTSFSDQQEGGHIEVLLMIQSFLELIREHRIDDAVAFARTGFRPILHLLAGSDLALLKDAMALLAYTNPEDSPVGNLLAMEHRTSVADQVNRFILKAQGQRPYSSLERAFQHALLSHHLIRQLRGGGEVLSAQRLVADDYM
eukprot:c12441_g1_i1.p1 GENE.c12441_g1_i1~~c12441_g1_i1.p1  ORF type:complete len:456 (+),score=110.89 c12441_g1_i1:59-1426(+)